MQHWFIYLNSPSQGSRVEYFIIASWTQLSVVLAQISVPEASLIVSQTDVCPLASWDLSKNDTYAQQMSENVICRTNIILASTGAIEITIPVCHLGTKFGSLVCSLINRLRLCESYFNALIALLVLSDLERWRLTALDEDKVTPWALVGAKNK